MAIQRGDIFLWSGSNFVAWCIQRLTDSRWSHTGFYLGDGKMLDADYDGVKVRDFSAFSKHPHKLKIIRPPFSKEQREAAMLRAMEHSGKAGYDYWLIWSLVRVLSLGKRQCGEVRDWDGAFICSELIADAYFKTQAVRFVPDCHDISATVPEDIDKKWGKHSVHL